jgi:hypothetical protein
MLIFRKFMFRGFALALAAGLLSACGDDVASLSGYNFDGKWYFAPSNLKTSGPCIFNLTPATITIKGQCSAATSSTQASLSPPVCNGNSISFSGSMNGALNSINMTAVTSTSMTGKGTASAGSCSAEYDLSATLLSR